MTIPDGSGGIPLVRRATAFAGSTVKIFADGTVADAPSTDDALINYWQGERDGQSRLLLFDPERKKWYAYAWNGDMVEGSNGWCNVRLDEQGGIISMKPPTAVLFTDDHPVED